MSSDGEDAENDDYDEEYDENDSFIDDNSQPSQLFVYFAGFSFSCWTFLTSF
jgi:hypothetical protein